MISDRPVRPLRQGRLPWPTPDELDPDRRALYDAIVGGPRAGDSGTFRMLDGAGRLEGPFNAMLVSPSIGDALQRLGAAIRYRSSLGERARELAILAVAARERCGFEWYAHEKLAREAGLASEALEAVRDGTEPPGLGALESAVLGAADALVGRGDLDDEEYARLVAAVGEAGAVEVVVLVGYYRLLAMMLRALRVPVPEGATVPAGMDGSAAGRRRAGAPGTTDTGERGEV